MEAAEGLAAPANSGAAQAAESMNPRRPGLLSPGRLATAVMFAGNREAGIPGLAGSRNRDVPAGDPADEASVHNVAMPHRSFLSRIAYGVNRFELI